MNKPSNKILLALQFWEGDKKQAMALARYIADLQTSKGENADFLLVSRFDCSHDQETIKYISRKFNVYTYRSLRKGVGWPNGCNELFFGTMEWVYHQIKAMKVPAYKAIFTFESDGAPLMSQWILHLSEMWDRLNSRKPVFVAGAMQTSPGLHINGNALFSGDLKFLYWLAKRVGGCKPNGGWDYLLAHEFKRWGWADVPDMRSWWAMKTISHDGVKDLIRDGVVWMHGIKDNTLLEHSRAILTGK